MKRPIGTDDYLTAQLMTTEKNLVEAKLEELGKRRALLGALAQEMQGRERDLTVLRDVKNAELGSLMEGIATKSGFEAVEGMRLSVDRDGSPFLDIPDQDGRGD